MDLSKKKEKDFQLGRDGFIDTEIAVDFWA